jgi:Uma2 family endonuclease
MSSDAARRDATYADLEAVPPHLVAEIINGSLHTHPRPVLRHGAASVALITSLGAPFQFGRGGPGGWIFIDEPELHLGPHVVVPDLAGWRTDRLPAVPDAPWIDLVPDWVCEILSPSTEALDRGGKRRVYATYGLKHYWLLSVPKRQLEAYELRDGNFVLLDTFEDDALVTAPPFGQVPFALSALLPAQPPSAPAG